MPDPPADATPAGPTQGVLDERSPEVTPRVLRRRHAGAPPPAQPPVDATLIDAITRIVAGMLERHVRESVTAAVMALAPRLVVSLPPGGAEGNQLRGRPARTAKRTD